MKGDFSRGHTPDRKRGQKYRRVLLQQGRVLLDSDLAAGVDTQDRLLRELANDVGCASGSPNLGYVVTPGPLFALFETLDRVSVVTAPGAKFRAYRDHGVKILGRYPALYLDARDAAGKVAIAGRTKLKTVDHPKLRIWARIPKNVTLAVAVDGKPATLQDTTLTTGQGDSMLRAYDIDVTPLNLSEYAVLELGLEPADTQEAWIGLVEGLQPAGTAPTFWFTAGHFYLDGLAVEHGPADGTWPESTFPTDAGFGTPDTRLGANALIVAFLEGWERSITAVEDPGILEQALGGMLDTTIRTQAMGQVKLAQVVARDVTDVTKIGDAVAEAFSRIDRGAANLEVTTTPSGADPDPCAIPVVGGYTGSENRLYRFEVHTGGNLGKARLKWSRDNAAFLRAVTITDANNGLVTLVGADTLQDGELVELLHEADALGDSEWAQVNLTAPQPTFIPPVRRTGTLYYVETTSKISQVKLLDLASKSPASLAAVKDKPGLAVRRWSGLCDTAQKSTFELGDGITITLTGTRFRSGDYWQYEARRNKDNANGKTWQKDPHGPERLFTPLALLEHDDAAAPLVLHRWYEHQYSALCELEADDIAYDGAKAETTAATVQEALDELFTRKPVVINGCGELVVQPDSDVQAAFDAIGPGQDARVCIQPGTWTLRKTVVVADKGNIVVAGAGRASVVSSSHLARVIRFERCASVHLHDFSVQSSKTATKGDGLAGALSIVDCPRVDIERLHVSTGAGGGPRRLVSGIEVVTESAASPSARVRIRGCEVRVGHAQVGIVVVDAASADIADNHVECPEEAWSLVEHIDDDDVAAWASAMMMGHLTVYDYQRFPSDLFLGPPVVDLGPYGLEEAGIRPDPTGRPTLMVGLSEWSSGGRVTSFTVPPNLNDASGWEKLLTNNPMTGWNNVDGEGRAVVHPDAWVIANLRRFRKNLVRAALGASSPVNLGDVGRPFIDLANRMKAMSGVTAGGQGIVVGGRRTPLVGAAFTHEAWNTLYVSTPRSPSVNITGNRVAGFTQGIHVGTSYNISKVNGGRRLRSYRTQVQGNEVHLRVPAIARERHGLFVGNAHSVQITDNLVELVHPDIHRWREQEPLDGIRLWGSYGPLLQVRGNHTVGVSTGIRVHALNPHLAKNPGASWLVRDNAYAGFGKALDLKMT